MLQIVASLTDNSRGVIYDRNIFKIQAAGNNPASYLVKSSATKKKFYDIDIFTIYYKLFYESNQ